MFRELFRGGLSTYTLAGLACGGPPWHLGVSGVRVRCALLSFVASLVLRCDVWFWGAHSVCGCLRALQPSGGRYGQMVMKTHEEEFAKPEHECFALGLGVAFHLAMTCCLPRAHQLPCFLVACLVESWLKWNMPGASSRILGAFKSR